MNDCRLPKNICVLILCLFVATAATAQVDKSLKLSATASANAFTLFNSRSVASFRIDSNDAKVVAIAAAAFISDVALVSGKRMQLSNDASQSGMQIIAGTIGQSKWIDDLIKEKRVDIAEILNKRECFSILVLKGTNILSGASTSPLGGPGGLLIAGSDPRGTAYGILHLSKLMGVSPWVWWADAVPQQKDQLFISGSYTSAEPSVKYRGIFINDEDWGLQPWAAKTFEPEVGDIGPKTYSKVFELLLRLKANLIWPAMHPSTKAFFTIPGNAKVAADYAIVIGSSHAEPMLRNNVGEWDEKTMGHFNYVSNKDKVMQYWESRVKESSNVNAMFTMGMRGVHDGKMEGVKDNNEAVPLLENIIKEQRLMLSTYVNKDVTKIPQVFTAYKEVLDIYDNGLKLPEDVTLVWPDDNYGYIQRLNNPAEKQRAGGSGVYYHASYWGRPHDYLWLSSTHPALIREEMMKAYQNGSKDVWVLNVGDIKPLEYNIELFMDMAYDTKPFADPAYSQQHLLQWTGDMFGKKNAAAIQSILWKYYQLAFERRPEFMGWSQTEPTTKTALTGYNHFSYGDEARQRISQYQSLENKVKQLSKLISKKDLAAFYELVYYPVVCASLMNKKFLYKDKYFKYAEAQRLSAMDYARASQAAYDSIVMETDHYNKLLNGKWSHIMSMQPRNLPVFDEPGIKSVESKSMLKWDVTPEGSAPVDAKIAEQYVAHLPAFDNINKQSRFIDIFLCDSSALRWVAVTKAKWIQLSQSSGKMDARPGKKEQRLQVKIDWASVPAVSSFSDTLWFKGNGKVIPVIVKANKYKIGNFKGFIENAGMLDIHAAHFTSHSGLSTSKWKLLPGLGYTDTALQSVIQEPSQQLSINTMNISRNNAWVEYDFLVFSAAPARAIFYTLPTHPLNNMTGMRYAVSLDGGPVQIIDFHTIGRSEEWKQNVLRNRAEKTIALSYLNKGRHTLRIYAIDPGVILDEIRIDLGGLKNAYSSIEETKTK